MDKQGTLFKKIACAAALKSGAFIKRHIGKIKKVSYKSEINLVTDVDKKSEKIIIDIIKNYFPHHTVLSEEKRPPHTDAEYKWVIDPLDGTTNYAHGFPVFCVSIALEKTGIPILGVVYDPTRDELFYAEAKKGAFLNNRRISVSRVKRLGRALVATGFAYNVRECEDDNIDRFVRFLKNAQAVRRAGSAALDMCYVACGRFDGFWELNLHPWDTAAGLVIVKESGGMVTKLDGSTYSHYDKEIMASNGRIHNQMREVLGQA